jgi:CubicO group peptidase (beta-lactamase class C family)
MPRANGQQRRRETMMNRAEFLHAAGRTVVAGLALSALSAGVQAAKPRPRQQGKPTNGFIVPLLMPMEQNVLAFMEEHEIPSGSLAVSKDGSLLVKRAYGYLDKDEKKALPVNAKFRLASIDKIITATGVEMMCRLGPKVEPTGEVFHRDLRVFRALWKAGVRPPEGAKPDPRIFEITVGHLLEHKSGLADLGTAREAMKGLVLTELPTPLDYLRCNFLHPLTFDPGAKSEYSNTGYATLRFILHWLSGDFLAFMKKHVLFPTGARDFGLTKCRPSERDPKEVWYSTKFNGPSLFPEDGGKECPGPEGGAGEYYDSTLVLTASAEAVVRYLDFWYFGAARLLRDPRTGKLAQGNDNGGSIYFGSMIGAATMMTQRRHTMCNVALLFNHREEREGRKSDMGTPVISVLEAVGL